MEKNQKQARYQRIILQLDALFTDCTDPIARMATISAVLHHKMDHFFWTGFYLLRNGELTIGPYQGSLACMVLKKNTGVCWAAINRNEPVVVPDVHEFAGHIACDSRSNSEITLPLKDLSGQIIGVLDIDSREFSNFDDVDAEWLTQINQMVYKVYERI